MEITLPLLRELSKFEHLGKTFFTQSLTKYLRDALEDNDVLEHMPIPGETSSVRLFLTHYRPGIPRNEGMHLSAEKAASELFSLSLTEARYDPATKPGAIKGWAVDRIRFQGRPAALVTAVWIDEE